jgi:hypothetical protein
MSILSLIFQQSSIIILISDRNLMEVKRIIFLRFIFIIKQYPTDLYIIIIYIQNVIAYVSCLNKNFFSKYPYINEYIISI